ncbi:hypothetical protein EMIT0196P_10084 [Pseudomonas chlororaphis]
MCCSARRCNQTYHGSVAAAAGCDKVRRTLIDSSSLRAFGSIAAFGSGYTSGEMLSSLQYVRHRR